LEDELDIVKKEILKILSEKSKCSKENAELKKALVMTDLIPLTLSPQEVGSTGLADPGLTCLADPKKLQDRYSPDGQEDLSIKSSSIKFVGDVESKKSSKDEIVRKELEAKCQQLEESLELMQAEFEKMEDYWQVLYKASVTIEYE
jgi:hypothetical protein